MSDSEDEVTTLQDPLTYTKAIPKDEITHTVRGLTPDVSREETYAEVRNSPRVFSQRNGPRSEFFGRLPMLIVPLLLGALSVLARVVVAPLSPLEFPARPDDLWPFASAPGERVVYFAARVAALWVPSALAGLFALSLAWTVGTAARHFSALCGVGIAVLALLATAGQLVLLRFACDWSRASGRSECDVPFVLYWTFGVARAGGPLLAVWCNAPALATVQRHGPALSTVLAVPTLGFAAAVLLSAWSAEPALGAFALCRHAATAAWIILLFVCARIPSFVVRFEQKEHVD